MGEKQRHLHSIEAIEAIDQGLEAAERVTVLDGVNAAVNAGRLSVREAIAIMELYNGKAERVVPLPDYPDDAA